MMPFSAWFDRFPKRLTQEEQTYSEEGLNFRLNRDILNTHRVVVFDGELEVNGEQYSMRVVYPSGFPYIRPEIMCDAVRLSRHQNPYERNLCVIPNEQEAWRASDTGAYLVKQAAALIKANQEGPELVTAQEVDAPEPASSWYGYTTGCSLIVLEEIPDLQLNYFGTFRVALRSPYPGGPGLQAVLIEVQSAAQGPVWRLPDALKHAALGEVKEGTWIRLPEPPPYLTSVTGERGGYREYQVWAQSRDKNLEYRLSRQRNTKAYALIYPDEGPVRGQVHQNWLMGMAVHGLPEPVLLRPFLWTATDYFFRIPSLQELQDKKVLIVGLGALGSPIAAGLARAGTGHLGLVDFDVVEPGPLIRQEYDLRDVGLLKVDAQARRVRQINPRISQELFPINVGAADLNLSAAAQGFDSLAAFAQRLHQYDLFINATGRLSVDMIINEISRAFGIPAVFTCVFNGAWGGQVFRSRPGQACFECLRYYWPRITLPPEDPSALPIYARGCGYPTFTGTGFDSAAIANVAVRSAVQTMLSTQPGAYPDVPGNLINCTNRNSETGDSPCIDHLTVPQQQQCWTCHQYGK